MTDENLGLKRLPDITISGAWDPQPPVDNGVCGFAIYPRSVTIFGWTIWSERTTLTARMEFAAETTEDGLTMVEGIGKQASPALRERAPWPMRLAWYTVGFPIWWLRSWRATE